MKNLKLKTVILALLASVIFLNAQAQWTRNAATLQTYVTNTGDNVGIGTTNPNASALLEMTSGSKGVLIPRMTLIQRNAISSPATGLLIYQTNTNPGFYYYTGSAWMAVNNVNGLNNNVFIGQNAGVATTASYNVAIGKASLKTNTTGSYNSSIGDSSLYTNTSGSFNIAIGAKSLRANTTGHDMIAIGVECLKNNTTGLENTAVGSAAGYSNTTGTSNCIFGRSSLFYNTTGSYNTVYGYKAAQNNTTANSNSAFGYRALYTNSVGLNNASFGYKSLLLATGGGNTAFGAFAGDAITTGINNTFIGSGASGSPTISNSTAIGSSASVTASNCIVLGSGIENVGIGVTAPAYKLDVCGAIRAKEVRVETGWCDYVFADEYKLPKLSEVESYIKENKHLPEVTPGNIIETEGLEVGKVSSQMIKKIEELTLYVIQQQKELDNLKAHNSSLEAKVNSLVNEGGK